MCHVQRKCILETKIRIATGQRFYHMIIFVIKKPRHTADLKKEKKAKNPTTKQSLCWKLMINSVLYTFTCELAWKF